MNIPDNIKKFGMKVAYSYLDKDPEKNVPKLMDWVDRILPPEAFEGQRKVFRTVIEDPDNNWFRLIRSVWTDIDSGVRKAIFQNFFVNANFKWTPKQKEIREKYNLDIPWAILMDPTSACNLKCTGCWAAEYGDKLNMSYETLDSIIEQGKDIGISFFIYSGGEPLVRKKDIISLCAKHEDCQFLAFTNGTLIDEEFANEMLRVKNFIPAISVEGFEQETDSRRGQGTFARVQEAMAILKRKKLPFGVSCCYTSKNVDAIGSEEYFDWMIDQGVKFCWFFTYIPVGKAAVPELMVSPEQREFMYRQVRKFRDTKPIFTMDFWNDGEYVEGCIAGGRKYLHINAGGDIEPCAFIHYSDSNIHEKTLLEALQSPLFMAYRKGQPFNSNHLRPCPLLDNPQKLREMVESTGAYSTDLAAPENVRDLTDKCVETSKKWAVKADELWQECGKACAGCAEKNSSVQL